MVCYFSVPRDYLVMYMDLQIQEYAPHSKYPCRYLHGLTIEVINFDVSVWSTSAGSASSPRDSSVHLLPSFPSTSGDNINKRHTTTWLPHDSSLIPGFAYISNLNLHFGHLTCIFQLSLKSHLFHPDNSFIFHTPNLTLFTATPSSSVTI